MNVGCCFAWQAGLRPVLFFANDDTETSVLLGFVGAEI